MKRHTIKVAAFNRGGNLETATVCLCAATPVEACRAAVKMARETRPELRDHFAFDVDGRPTHVD